MSDSKFNDIALIADQPVDDIDLDILGLEPWAKMIAGVAAGTRGPFTIGLHGSWGYGKTSLLGLAKNLIDRRNDKSIVTVWFNAWQFEREDHPLFSLIAAIADEIGKKAKGKPNHLSTIGKSLRALACGMKFKADVGVPLVGAVGVEFDAEKTLKAVERLGKRSNPLQGEMMYHAAFSTLRQEAEKAKDFKIIVFVDDLDRCHPEKAIFLLESIKLILSQPGFVFVLAIDRPVLESFLERRYLEQCGTDHGGRGKSYLDKIVQLPITIPSHRSRFDSYVDKLIKSLPPSQRSMAEMLDRVKGIVAAGAITNPRSLVRLINGFLFDASLWPLISREGAELRKYQELTDDVAAALVINSTLHMVLGEDYSSLIYGSRAQDLCDGTLRGDTGQSRQKAAEEPDTPESRVESSILSALAGKDDLVAAIRESGQVWLRDGRLRIAVYDFAPSSRPSGPVDLPEVIARAVRSALRLKISDPIPSERLSEVTGLVLSGEKTADEDLQHLGRLTNLRELRIGRAQVTDAGCAHLEPLTNLQKLALDGMRVTDAGLAHLARLTNLRELGLSRTQVTDAGLAHLERLTNLRKLVLDGTQVTNEGLAHLEPLANLRHLGLGGTRVTDEGLAHLEPLTSLEYLSLGETQVTDEGLAHLEPLTNLQMLSLNRTQVTDAGLAHLARLTNLRELNLGRTQVTDAGLAHLERLTNLQYLDLGGTQVTDAGLAHLAQLPNLQTLSLAETQVTDAGLVHLERLTVLQTLWLGETQVTAAGCAALRNRGVDVNL